MRAFGRWTILKFYVRPFSINSARPFILTVFLATSVHYSRNVIFTITIGMYVRARVNRLLRGSCWIEIACLQRFYFDILLQIWWNRVFSFQNLQLQWAAKIGMEKCDQRRSAAIEIRAQTKCIGHIPDEHEDGNKGVPTFSHENKSVAFGWRWDWQKSRFIAFKWKRCRF